LFGFLIGLSENRQLFTPETRMLIFVGFLGGFTTFSTFGYEVFSFARDGQIISLLVNILLHLVLGIGAVWLGYSLSKLN
jgi:CrcB protein